MLSGVVKWIMNIVDLMNWFLKPRLRIEPTPTEELTTRPQLQKNPRYKSSNGF